MKPTIYIPSALARLLIPRLPSFDRADKPALEWRARFRPNSAVWSPRHSPEADRTGALAYCA